MDYIKEHIQYVNDILDTNDMILTDIYVIVNNITHKKYVGQANTHRLNHMKYRPFGYKKRFKDHVSEALNNTKKKQCSLLNNSIRKYGCNVFTVELLTRCLPAEANDKEKEYIRDLDTLAPNGYNLSVGGGKGCLLYGHRVSSMNNTIAQFAETKLAKYRDVNANDICITQVWQHIKEQTSYGNIYYRVTIKGIDSIFVGKYLPKEKIKQRAIDFVKEVYKRSISQHDQIAGTS